MGDLLLQLPGLRGRDPRGLVCGCWRNDNGLPFDCVRRLAENLGEREDFGRAGRCCANAGGRAVQ
jgi:hypothetical protein